MGQFTVDPAERDEFVAARAPLLEAVRKEAGCLEYTIAADPGDPGRAVLVERWESEEALDAHAANLKNAPKPTSDVKPTSLAIFRYDVTGEKKLF